MQSAIMNESGELCRRVTRSQTKHQIEVNNQWMPWIGQSFGSLKKQQEKDPDIGKIYNGLLLALDQVVQKYVPQVLPLGNTGTCGTLWK
jgi:hypothetical protein